MYVAPNGTSAGTVDTVVIVTEVDRRFISVSPGDADLIVIIAIILVITSREQSVRGPNRTNRDSPGGNESQ
jgi:hypothetical protein